MTGKDVAELRERVRKLFEFGDSAKEMLRGSRNPFTGETAVEVGDRLNESFFLYLDSPAFDRVLEVLDGPEAPRQAAHIVTYLRNSAHTWRRLREIHPRVLIEKASDMESDRRLALSLLAQLQKILSFSYRGALASLIEQVKQDAWPLDIGYLSAIGYDNDTFASGPEIDGFPRTKPTFDLLLVGNRGASSKPAGAWRGLRVRALDSRLPVEVPDRNAVIAQLLALGGETGITRQHVRSILVAKLKHPNRIPAK